MAVESLMPLIILLPLVAALLIKLTGNNPNLRETVTLIASVLLFILLIPLSETVLEGGRPTYTLAEPFPGIALQFTLEPLGMLFALIAGFLWIVTSIYAIGYMRGHHEKNQTRFYMFFAIAIAVTQGVAFSGNLFTLFVFYEMLTLSTFPLVTHAGTEDARRAGRIYLGILIGTSIAFLLLALIWTWYLAGTVEFTNGGILDGTASPAMLGVLVTAVLLRRWQSRLDALPSLAACGDGCSDTGKCIAARSRRGQGRRVFATENFPVHFRTRSNPRTSHYGSSILPGCSLHFAGVTGRHDQGQSESATCLFDCQPAWLYHAWRTAWV